MTSSHPRIAPGTTAWPGQAARACPLCAATHLAYQFMVDGYALCRCEACTLLFLNPQPGRTDHAASLRGASSPRSVYEVHATNAATRVDQLIAYAGNITRLLMVANDEFLESEAKRRQLDVVRLSTDEVERDALARLNQDGFDAVVFACTLERLSAPEKALRLAAQRLTPTGVVMVLAPTVDSRTAHLFRSSWWEFTRENLHYFTADTLQSLLVKSGYGDVIIDHDDAVVSLEYLRAKLPFVSSALLRASLGALIGLTPRPLRNHAFRFLNSRRVVLARRGPAREPRPTLSVIVPAYNERETFPTLMDRLLAKSIDDVDIEIVLVESNSSDGTRDQAIRYGQHPRVRLILEDKPSGKGHAVRRGLAACSGDIVMFQDADLEYDIDDYDGLVAPLLAYQRNFVIGSRHSVGTVWKIRQFNDATSLAAVFNFGHVIFLTLLNTLYRQRLRDPFSMFKVFRRDCLYGLTFECNRFDFDFEIVIKLLRKGYQPLELPVNYYARSPAEGKKVTMIRDPLTWIRALVKFRWSPLYRGASRE